VLLVGMGVAGAADVLRVLVWWDEGRRLKPKQVLLRELREGTVESRA
jgi:hypothetical protein